ncbi:MAG: DNA repair protein RadC [Acetobacteraceae bacterium]|nr:DNA repair protein RadC [Acetobacteraceae bacterium]
MAKKQAGLSEQLGMLEVPSSSAPTSAIGAEGHRDRMRTRILSGQGETMADYELLEMVLFVALPRIDTKTLAKTLIARFGSYSAVISAPREELLEVKGIGESAVATLKVIQLAAQRLARAEVLDRPVLGNWDRLMDYLHTVLARERVEQFRVLFLDTRNRLLADEAQARGTVNHTPVYPREVVRRALELKATALILVHNHPSGDPTPSRDDIEMTQEVKRAATALSITLHDHVIVGNGKWLSFRQEKLL